MSFEQALAAACKKKGLEFLSIDGGYCFVKDKDGKIFPIAETTAAIWIKNNLT